MKLIILLCLPLSIFAQHHAGPFVGSGLAYNYNAVTGDHNDQGTSYTFGVSTFDYKTNWLYFGFRFGGAYTRQPQYKSVRLLAEVSPEIRIYKGLFIGKVFYLSPSIWEQQGEIQRGTALEIGHGINLSYNFRRFRLESYYAKSANKIFDTGRTFARSYGLRLAVWVK